MTCSHSKTRYFIFSDHKIVLCTDQGATEVNRADPFPSLTREQADAFGLKFVFPIQTADGIDSFCAQGSSKTPLPNDMRWVNLRPTVLWMAPELFQTAGYAKQVYEWNSNTLFCTRCANKLDTTATEELVRTCSACGLDARPKISPAIIVAITRGDKILLARGANFPDKEMFSVLAGFSEPCESLEDTVRREVFEEVGIRVKNIRYFESQPWPFPDSLMIGFTAEYESGELCPEKDEIAEALWFTASDLPKIPSPPTISRALIDTFVNRMNHTNQNRPVKR